jgi:hypothetical protein
MRRNTHPTAIIAAGATLAANLAEAVSSEAELEAWQARLQSEDDRTRAQAWYNAGPIGAGGVPHAASLMANPNREIALAAKRALQQIAHYAARPGADSERTAVVQAFLKRLDSKQLTATRLVAVSVLSEIGGDESVDAIAVLLAEPDLREAARMALEQLPGQKSLAALQKALTEAPDDFKPNLAQSLRRRGVEVANVPDGKLTPSKPTQVQPASAPSKN